MRNRPKFVYTKVPTSNTTLVLLQKMFAALLVLQNTLLNDHVVNCADMVVLQSGKTGFLGLEIALFRLSTRFGWNAEQTPTQATTTTELPCT